MNNTKHTATLNELKEIAHVANKTDLYEALEYALDCVNTAEAKDKRIAELEFMLTKLYNDVDEYSYISDDTVVSKQHLLRALELLSNKGANE